MIISDKHMKLVQARQTLIRVRQAQSRCESLARLKQGRLVEWRQRRQLEMERRVIKSVQLKHIKSAKKRHTKSLSKITKALKSQTRQQLAITIVTATHTMTSL